MLTETFTMRSNVYIKRQLG